MNKKITIILAIGFVIVAIAAFVGGRLLNGRGLGPLGFMPFGPGGGQFAMSINLQPAPELPTTPSDLTGLFVERKDNIITVQSFAMNGEGGGVVVSSAAGSNAGEDPSITTSSADMSNGPKTEVVVTGKTIIYRDSTEMGMPSSSQESSTIQQTVEKGTLGDLQSQTMVQVWGRKNGDRLIADIILYSTPITVIQK